MTKAKIHIITGATGFLGNNLIREFLSRGDNLILFVRGKDGISAEDRVVDILKLTDTELRQVRVFDVDILQPVHEQVSVEDIQDAFGTVNNIWHLAANLSFRFEERNKTIGTNVGGTQHMTRLAQELDVRLFYFSTAYMHGKRRGALLETEVIKAKYNNPYEESKYLTETYLHEEMEKGLQCTIFRPAILFDATPYHRQGHVSGYYVLLLSMWNVSRGLVKFIKQHVFISRLLGISVSNDGVLLSKYIPYTATNSRMNLIAVQDALTAIFKIYDRQEIGKNQTYHIVSPSGISIRDVVNVMFNTHNIHLKIITTPVWIAKFTLYVIRALGYINKLFAGFGRKIKYYEFYLINTQEFDLTNVYSIIPQGEYNKMFDNELDVLRVASKRFIELW